MKEWNVIDYTHNIEIASISTKFFFDQDYRLRWRACRAAIAAFHAPFFVYFRSTHEALLPVSHSKC